MASTRQLQLAKREDFFSDPFFKEIWSNEDVDLQKRLDAFKKSSALATATGSADTAHNLQVSCSNDKFMVQLELPGFQPEDFSLKAKDDVILLEAVHEAKAGGEGTSRKYAKEFKVPEGVLKEQLASSYSSEGILTITAPRVLNAPEGAEVQEAMAAASKAYTTDDGRTSVKQDSQSSSQMIATSTQSEDGSSKSSMSFSSSSMSSSSSTTTSSTLGGGSVPSLEMDDMMKKMMASMNMDAGAPSPLQMGSTMSSGFSSSSMSSKSVMSSSSTTSSSSMTSKMMGGADMPSLMGNMGNFLDIEELSTAGTEFSGPPAYTVTSPRASVDNSGSGFKFSVQPTPDYKPKSREEPDCSVLLKLKQGDEYKLVLNMQSYSPENITVKLNGSELTVTASADSDNFRQVHVVPEGIDLDLMTSSFSSDGILVIKAPKKK